MKQIDGSGSSTWSTCLIYTFNGSRTIEKKAGQVKKEHPADSCSPIVGRHSMTCPISPRGDRYRTLSADSAAPSIPLNWTAGEPWRSQSCSQHPQCLGPPSRLYPPAAVLDVAFLLGLYEDNKLLQQTLGMGMLWRPTQDHQHALSHAHVS